MTLVGLGVVADDLTGAMDTGVQFRRSGAACVVYLTPAALSGDGGGDGNRGGAGCCRADDGVGVGVGVGEHIPCVLVANTDTRNRPAEEARRTVEAVCDGLKRRGVTSVYKKIDSTLRGNIGVELDAVMDCIGSRFACVVPAFPALGRTTIGGNMLLNGRPVKDTEISTDALSPVRDSHVPTVLRRQSRRLVGEIPLEQVRQGVDVLAGCMRQAVSRGVEIVVIDSQTQLDLDSVAAAVTGLGIPTVMCGSAGLALGIVNSLDRPGPSEVPGPLPSSPEASRGSRASRAKPAVIVIGSRSRVSAGQLDYLKARAPVVHFDLGMDELEATGGQRLEYITKALADGCDVVLSATAVPPCPGYGSDKIVAGLGGVVRQSLEVLGSCSLILTGGDTAVGVCSQLEASRIILAGEILPGMPMGTLAGGPFDGITVVTKAGAFGDATALLQALRYVRNGARGDALEV